MKTKYKKRQTRLAAFAEAHPIFVQQSYTFLPDKRAETIPNLETVLILPSIATETRTFALSIPYKLPRETRTLALSPPGLHP